MSDRSQFLSNHRSVRMIAFVILGLLLLARIGYGQIQTKEAKNVVLQGSIYIQPLKKLSGDPEGKIQPGTGVKISVLVENKGQQNSPKASIYIRYAFAQPLDQETKSVIFETEKKELPSIESGKAIEISFEKPHLIPTVFDFIRYDWPLREYQAIVVVNEDEHLIGTLVLTFSTYYYPGIQKELPIKIPSD